MDPAGSDLDSSLPQPDNPCLIVEDSQPDSVALEDDPESSYRALLARRLSNLQPAARSPVLELISSPLGSRCSQTDSQSESSQTTGRAQPGVVMAADPSSAFQEESQVLSVSSPPSKNKCPLDDGDVDRGADSTTHCIQSEEGTSQFGFLELSQSQDLRGEVENSQQEVEEEEDDAQSDRRTKSADQNFSSRTSQSPDHRAVRSEVISSSSSGQLGIQALLHSESLKATQDDHILSSQEDMFDADKSGGAVDSTVSEPDPEAPPTSQAPPTSTPTPTPAQSLRLLHLSGQGTLVQESLSQCSVDFVAATPDRFTGTPLIVPSSPTENADEPMDTSLPPEEEQEEEKEVQQEEEEPMETEADAKPRPSASSTPLSQNPPGFVLERTLSLPSQPEFSHDVFVPTQSQDAAQPSNKKPSPSPSPPHHDSAVFTLPLQLEDDSQATQIEDLDQSDASQTNGVQSQTANAAESPKTPTVNVQTVNVNKEASGDEAVSCSPDVAVNSCVRETPPPDEPSQSVISQTPDVDAPSRLTKESVGVAKGTVGVAKESVGVAKDAVDAAKDSLDTEKDSMDVVKDSVGVAKDSVGVAKDSVGVTKDSVGVAKDSVGVVNDSMEVKDSMDAANDSVDVVKDSMDVAKDSVGVVKDSMDVAKDSVGVAKDSVGVAKDSVGVAKDSSDAALKSVNSQTAIDVVKESQRRDEQEESMEEGESAGGGGASGLALILDQTETMTPPPPPPRRPRVLLHAPL